MRTSIPNSLDSSSPVAKAGSTAAKPRLEPAAAARDERRRTSPGADPSAYRIGHKVRRLRLGRSMGLVELGRHTGLSASMLSKIETGKCLPTLPTLQRIALVFSVGLDHFFGGEDDKPTCAVVRREERLKFPEKLGAKAPGYWFESLDFPAVNRALNAYHAEFEAARDAGSSTHEHEGVEFVYVIEGTLGLWYDGKETRLEQGDAIYLDASHAHGYRRIGDVPCRGIVVTVP